MELAPPRCPTHPQVPFGSSASTEAEVYKAIQREPVVLHARTWERVSAAAKELVLGLLDKDPQRRYTLEQALAHPWVRGDAAPSAPLDAGLLSSLLHFSARNGFKRRAMDLVAASMSAAATAALREAFVRIDTDNSGVISHAELAEALRQAMGSGGSVAGGGRMSAETAAALVAQLDTDGAEMGCGGDGVRT